MNILFWIIWIGEFIGAGWWIVTELQLTHLKPNPYAFLSLLYLLAVLAIRYGAGLTKISMAMVAIPAIPLGALLLIIIVASLSGTRWN